MSREAGPSGLIAWVPHWKLVGSGRCQLPCSPGTTSLARQFTPLALPRTAGHGLDLKSSWTRRPVVLNWNTFQGLQLARAPIVVHPSPLHTPQARPSRRYWLHFDIAKRRRRCCNPSNTRFVNASPPSPSTRPASSNRHRTVAVLYRIVANHRR
jgi:hypothetical protein